MTARGRVIFGEQVKGRTVVAAARPSDWRRVVPWALAICASTVVLIGVLTAKSEAATPVVSFSITPSTTQAGAHPDIATQFDILPGLAQEPKPCNCNTVKDITINTPPGLVGTPTDTPRCTQSEFAVLDCPPDSQIGVVLTGLGVAPGDGGGWSFQPLYNMVPRANQLALWGTFTPYIAIPSIYTSITTRTESDFGLELKTFGIPGVGTPPEFAILTWGVPADHAHDVLRFPRGLPFPAFDYTNICNPAYGSPLPTLMESKFPEVACSGNVFNPVDYDPVSVNSAAVPYFSNPTACSEVLSTNIETLSYDLETDFFENEFPALSGCDQLSFNPSLSAKPTTTEADSPSGIDVALTVPQTLSPTTPTPSAIRNLSVTLPPGFTLNSNAADGKTACSDEQARFGTRLAAQCPEFSKIGTSETVSSSFPAVLPGAMYIGKPLPGNRYRVFLTADGFSIHLKLSGVVTPDPKTGQLTVTFKDLPQFAFQDFNLHFFGAERGLLATPIQCGTYPVNSEFTPWAAPQLPIQTSTQFFTIDSGPGGTPCPPDSRPFNPSFTAGVNDNTGGAHSSLTVDLNRSDGDQFLTALNVQTPPGFSATLKGIPYCSEAAIAQLQSSLYTGLAELASSSCPADSLVGTATAGAGAGSKPLIVNGKVYWAGPYKGAPLSLLVVIPAVSGPYDLGNVAVRVALNVDPITAQVSATSDPLPQILEGIPLRTREIRVDLDRKDFVLNPTNCDPLAVNATASGDQGATAELSSHFQVANCAVLPFEPKVGLQLRGGTKRTAHPRLRAVLRANEGDANLSRTSVAMPHSIFLDNAHLNNICTRAAYAANSCPKGSIYGHATATTPILDQPLSGPVYLRSSGKALPDLVLDLKGQVDFQAIAHIDSKNQGIRTTFDFLPDVPLQKVVLNMKGGAKGLLQVSSDHFCARPGRATVRMSGQNGKRANSRVELQTDCSKAKRQKRATRVLRHRKAA